MYTVPSALVFATLSAAYIGLNTRFNLLLKDVYLIYRNFLKKALWILLLEHLLSFTAHATLKMLARLVKHVIGRILSHFDLKLAEKLGLFFVCHCKIPSFSG